MVAKERLSQPEVPPKLNKGPGEGVQPYPVIRD